MSLLDIDLSELTGCSCMRPWCEQVSAFERWRCGGGGGGGGGGSPPLLLLAASHERKASSPWGEDVPESNRCVHLLLYR